MPDPTTPRSRAAAREAAKEIAYGIYTWRGRSPQFMNAQVSNLADVIAKHFPAESGWVSVASGKLSPSITFQQVNSGARKPEEILVCHADGRMSVGYNRDGNYAMARPTGKPTHWRPLPAPPEKE